MPLEELKTPLSGVVYDKPVNIIILFAVKNSDATTTHIKLLQKVAILLADDEVIGQFQTVQTKEDFIKLLAKNQD